MIARPAHFSSDGERLAGQLLLPEGRPPFPAVLLVGGTLSDTREGDPAESPDGRWLNHGLLRLIAQTTAEAGYASLRWDKRGVGESTGGPRDLCADVETDVTDAQHALETLASTPEVDPNRVVVLGESAGAYFSCLLAARTDLPCAYILQGALHRSIIDLYRDNFLRTEAFCASDPDREAWLMHEAPAMWRRYRHGPAILEAAQRGEDEYFASDEGEELRLSLRRLKFEMANPPAEMFRHIQKPALVIQGNRDMNVPPDDCYAVVTALKMAGNRQITLVVVPNADHSMQESPDDEDLRLRERLSFESFHRPYSPFYLEALKKWLRGLR